MPSDVVLRETSKDCRLAAARTGKKIKSVKHSGRDPDRSLPYLVSCDTGYDNNVLTKHAMIKYVLIFLKLLHLGGGYYDLAVAISPNTLNVVTEI